jgi:hypothetical protein
MQVWQAGRAWQERPSLLAALGRRPWPPAPGSAVGAGAGRGRCAGCGSRCRPKPTPMGAKRPRRYGAAYLLRGGRPFKDAKNTRRPFKSQPPRPFKSQLPISYSSKSQEAIGSLLATRFPLLAGRPSIFRGCSSPLHLCWRLLLQLNTEEWEPLGGWLLDGRRRQGISSRFLHTRRRRGRRCG